MSNLNKLWLLVMLIPFFLMFLGGFKGWHSYRKTKKSNDLEMNMLPIQRGAETIATNGANSCQYCQAQVEHDRCRNAAGELQLPTEPPPAYRR